MSAIPFETVWQKLLPLSSADNVADTGSNSDSSDLSKSAASPREVLNFKDVISELGACGSDPVDLDKMKEFANPMKPWTHKGYIFKNCLDILGDEAIRSTCKHIIKTCPYVFDDELRKSGLTTDIFRSVARLVVRLHECTCGIEVPDHEARAMKVLFKDCSGIILFVCYKICTTYFWTDVLPDEPDDLPDVLEELQSLVQSDIISFLLIFETEVKTDLRAANGGTFDFPEFPENSDRRARMTVVWAFHAAVRKEFLQLEEDGGPRYMSNFEALVENVHRNSAKVGNSLSHSLKCKLIEVAYNSAGFLADVRSVRGQSASTGALNDDQKKNFKDLRNNLTKLQITWQ